MVLQVIVLVAHEERRHPVGQNRARSQNGIGLMFQQRVLAHAANVHEGVDEEHRYQPRMNQQGSGNRRCDDCKCENHNTGNLEGDPESLHSPALAKTEDGDRRDISRIPHDQPAPVHRKHQPTPSRVVIVVIRIPGQTQMIVMPQVQHLIRREILQYRPGADRSERSIQSGVRTECSMNRLMGEKAYPMQCRRSQKVEWQAHQIDPAGAVKKRDQAVCRAARRSIQNQKNSQSHPMRATRLV